MANPREFLKRIEALNGGPLRDRPAEPVDAEVVRQALRRSLGGTPPAEPRVLSRPGGLPPARALTLEDAAAGCVQAAEGFGQAYVITTPVSTLETPRRHVRDQYARALQDPASGLHGRLCRRGTAPAPEDIVFIDLETTGLAHAPLFLIGAMFWEDGDLVVRQYLARDYAEEPAATRLFLEHAADARLLVSFNGKSFDLPYLRTRAIANAVPFALRADHVDLLHESRRAWRRQLPNCKLQTLEQCICGHPPRHGDIPGAAIPEAYHAFVRTANAIQLAQIIRHNLLDLVTLAELMTKLPPVEAVSANTKTRRYEDTTT